ncbi:MAG: glycosyltransferase family 2 protein [Brumimicrobium sp.]|nr:glycosyltransferase family 2 protein [Brumimicrobium sp.]
MNQQGKNSPVKLSVIIVNYNVEYFLEQCLNSVIKALENLKGEVFVVDNNSIDGSVEMVREKFPGVRLIANKKNLGFSKANNLAMHQSNGEYVLLLNPDTVVEEDTFEKCVEFMDNHPEAGGLGIRMIDGKGKFLPESKRGLPTPSVAFYKIFGLSRLFPKSKKFGKYHLGYLDEFETNEIEILSGAYMFLRKAALDKVGLLDEAFFMYGEDIDLSFRILKGGYKNYYFPKAQIIHYKGESTKKSSINYVFVFYRAMVIFAKKHFSQKNAKLFSFFINMAIYFRAGLALFSRFIKRIALPAIDIAIIVTGLLFLTDIWKHEHIEFPSEVLKYAIPGYAVTWFLSILFSGGYDLPIRLKSYLKGGLIGTALLLIIYALLPKEVQFSRLFILLGAAWVMIYYLFSRILLHFILRRKYDLNGIKSKTFAIVGEEDEVIRVKQILSNTANKIDFIHTVSPTTERNDEQTGTIEQLDQIIHIHGIDEVIFCAKNNSAETIIHWMSYISSKDIEFKIAQPDSLYLIGSNSVDTAGDLYVMEIDKITKPSSKRNKRAVDFIFSSLLLIFSPLIIWFFSNKKRFMKNIWGVFLGSKSLVGYSVEPKGHPFKLPRIKNGILTPTEERNSDGGDSLKAKLNLIYARDYNALTDLQILWRNWRKLDR